MPLLRSECRKIQIAKSFDVVVLARLRLRPTRRVAVVAPIAGSLTRSGKTSLKDR